MTECVVLRLLLLKAASRHGRYLHMYRIKSRVQLKRRGLPAWGLGNGLTTLHRKILIMLQDGTHSFQPGLRTLVHVAMNVVVGAFS